MCGKGSLGTSILEDGGQVLALLSEVLDDSSSGGLGGRARLGGEGEDGKSVPPWGKTW